jgi:uncharacterized membrane protein YfcA
VHLDLPIVCGSAIVGVLVGMTGAGGGALMTPMLVLLFSVKPSSAISSDLVAAVVMRPFGAAVHLQRRNVNWRLAGWTLVGSVPMALLGAYVLHLLGDSKGAETHVEQALGIALLLGAGGMVLRAALDRRFASRRAGSVHDIAVHPWRSLAIGAVGGFVVGMTSVGSGSLMVVLLLAAYPTLRAGQLVGTDLTQAVPLTMAGALGALLFGQVAVPVTASVVVGSVPAVVAGALVSSRVPERVIRPVIVTVVFASGLHYAGLGSTATLVATAGAVAAAVLLYSVDRARRGPAASSASGGQTVHEPGGERALAARSSPG